jgi:hypothetical protein
MTTLIGRIYAYCKKTDSEFGFDDADALPVESRRFLLNYGWKQWQADSHAADKRENFPTGAAGTEMWKVKVTEHIMERHTAIVTGKGLPGEPKLSAAAELAARDKKIAELEAIVARLGKKAA